MGVSVCVCAVRSNIIELNDISGFHFSSLTQNSLWHILAHFLLKNAYIEIAALIDSAVERHLSRERRRRNRIALVGVAAGFSSKQPI
jgi:hypothetical protein